MNYLNEEENALMEIVVGHFTGGCLVPIKECLAEDRGEGENVEIPKALHPPPVVQNTNICACLGVKLVIYLTRGGGAARPAQHFGAEMNKRHINCFSPLSGAHIGAGKNCRSNLINFPKLLFIRPLGVLVRAKAFLDSFAKKHTAHTKSQSSASKFLLFVDTAAALVCVQCV